MAMKTLQKCVDNVEADCTKTKRMESQSGHNMQHRDMQPPTIKVTRITCAEISCWNRKLCHQLPQDEVRELHLATSFHRSLAQIDPQIADERRSDCDQMPNFTATAVAMNLNSVESNSNKEKCSVRTLLQ